ncbi:MAG: glucose 1-dehydrogenase [Novosphingobium sp.]|nr:glucose 1-dehydrogenase [Novosphingobium sp.]
MGRVSGKVAIVTGGTTGIGEAVARMLAEDGARVVVAGTNADAGQRVASAIAKAGAITETGGEAAFFRFDVTDPQGWTAAFAYTEELFGACSVLVNNAGIAPYEDFETESLEDWRQVNAVNLDGVFLGTQAAVNHMKIREGGSIVNVSSVLGIVGQPATPAYSAAKGGVRAYSKSAALHCARNGYGIRVNSVHPGFVRTRMLEDAGKAIGDEEGFLAHAAAGLPMGRLGRPEEIAAGVLFLASDESSFMTGAELVIDGGYTAQ